MGEDDSSPTWAEYLSCISAEKTMAFKDTLNPDIYSKPQKYATGCSQASASQKDATKISFLMEPLRLPEGPRSRAKRHVYSQREQNADEPLDPEIKRANDVLLLMTKVC
jgi:hypothetical protein